MSPRVNGAYITKPGDMVRTPTGRTALVLELLPDGRREVKYIDGDKSIVVLQVSLLRVLVRAKPLPWRSRLPFEALDIDAGPRLTRRRPPGRT